MAQSKSMMRYLGGISGSAVLRCNGEEIARASYDFDGFFKKSVGSISDSVQWRRVLKDDVIFIAAGTIHAIGPGVVIAEIQQTSDATFRLFDHGRQRELHIDNAVAAANAGPAECQYVPKRLTEVRTLLVASPYFVLERIDLSPKSN
jgi:mannose-6-phosphate isomerase